MDTIRNIDFVSKYFKNRVEGHIDMFTGNLVAGWIKRRIDEKPVRIDVYINDICVTKSVKSDLMRIDLREAGYGNGCYGFELTLENFSMTADEAVVSVYLTGNKRPSLSRKFRPARHPTTVPTLIEADGVSQTSPAELTSSILALPPNESYHCKIDKLDINKITGWSVDRNAPNRIFNVDVLIDGQLFTTIRNDQPRSDLKNKGISDGFGGLYTSIPLQHLEGGTYTVAFRLPNGLMEERSVEIQPNRKLAIFSCAAEQAASLSVVVPVYNAVDDVRICIERLARFTPKTVDILFIDDCSSDPEITEVLKQTEAHSNMRVLRNAENIGFTRTVNRGLTETGQNDVIILNSDARVTPSWTQGLRAAALSGPRIATVTAMSDRAGAFSAPRIGNENELPEGVDEISYARAFRRRSLGLYPVVPTGNGFCMYISRACMNEIGLLDADGFPRGYGEENDFCMRAGRIGWRHIIDDRTYIFHDRSKSFGATKTDLMAAGRALIDVRYPEYKKAIQVFSTSEKIALARFRAQQALQDCLDGQTILPRILFVTATQTGGTPQTNRDLMEALSDSFDTWNLRCDSRMLELTRLVNEKSQIVRQHVLEEPVDPLTHRSMEYDAVVSDWLLAFDFDLVHIRHLAWHSLSLPRLVRNLGTKVIFSFHDFYTLSPTINLIDDTGEFLGKTFVPGGSKFRKSLWPQNSQPEPTGEWLRVWRERFESELRLCDAFITTSSSTRERVLNAMPSISEERFFVIPHGRDFHTFYRLRQPTRHGSPLRILVPGNIDVVKGLDIIYQLVEHDKSGFLEFHVLGDINLSGRQIHPRIIRHGKYARDDFAGKAGIINPHLGAVFSICDETYCHTLTELWSVGLPAIVFDFPTVATRVRNSGAGWVLDHRDIPALYDSILRLAFDAEQQKATDAAIADWQAGYGMSNTTRVMAAGYLAVYRDTGSIPISGTRARIAIVCPAENDLKGANASTHIRVWERTRNRVDRDVTYVRMTPETLLANLRSEGVDGAIIQRTAIPRTLVPSLLRAFADSGIPYLFDLDDDLLNVPSDKDPQGTYASYAPALRELLAGATMLTVSTPALLQTMRPINPRITLLPNRLSNRLWRPSPPTRRPDGTVRALYMGTVTHAADLAMILPALESVAAAHPEFRLTVIGGSSDAIGTPGHTGWLEHIAVPDDAKPYDAFVPWLRAQAARVDFAIAPLEDSPFNAGKSALKILDYAALALPVLASDVSVYRKTAKASPAAVLVPNTIAKWIAALKRQVALGEGNCKAGEAQRRWVLETGMLEESLTEFDNMLLTLTTNR